MLFSNAQPFLSGALDFASAAVGLAMLMCGWRLLRGPSAPDRVMALDTLYINVVALVVLLGIRWGNEMLFEAALIVALLGFVSTAALARYLCRGTVME
ncbi:K+/H+ antiporter subunit F [Roseateles koreensis]|uniref:K+/H+ antiporter subunit F n=1 Tax=Roseateles koreensis TaxID=2987526 RepID=A0ABT5KVM0_9BURK|nr:K+/H+ antiporter subunit F [Roseateles koreensis]MDC8786974.1 K+/H+ antiporter subunit F [Roseateles koreensis]